MKSPSGNYSSNSDSRTSAIRAELHTANWKKRLEVQSPATSAPPFSEGMSAGRSTAPVVLMQAGTPHLMNMTTALLRGQRTPKTVYMSNMTCLWV